MNDKLVAPITKDELMLVAQIIAWDKAPSRDSLYWKAPQKVLWPSYLRQEGWIIYIIGDL
jgi:hypothetical protein